METNGLVWYTATLSIFAVLSSISSLLYYHYWPSKVVFVVSGIVVVNFILLSIKLVRDLWHAIQKSNRPVHQQTGMETSRGVESLQPGTVAVEE